MGCVPHDGACEPHERPRHAVRITRPFLMSRTEVTVGEFRRFARETGYRSDAEVQGRGRMADTRAPDWEWRPLLSWASPLHAGEPAPDDWPAVQVSAGDATQYCQWDGGRLPTEAEWEYAARAGVRDGVYSWGDRHPAEGPPLANGPDRQGAQRMPMWETDSSVDDGYAMLSPVARFPPNAWGLHDMSGNVYEWTADTYDSTAYTQGAPRIDPHVRHPGGSRLARGGTWGYPPTHLRLSFRAHFPDTDFWTATLGFRCVRDLASRP